MSERDDPLRLADMAEQIDFLHLTLAHKSLDDFLADQVLQRAVAYSLHIIGEAANNLSEAAHAQGAEIPWPKIIALRNRIAHGYFALELDQIWKVATVDAPNLKQQLIAAGLLSASN